MPERMRRAGKAVCSSPPFGFVRRHYRGLGTILMYHRLVNRGRDAGGFDPNLGLSVHVQDFEAQLRHLTAHEQCLSLPAAVSSLRAGTLKRNSVVITFDDGYRDNLALAVPLLEKYQVPATIYITTGLIDRDATIWWYEQEFIVRRLTELRLEWKGCEYYWPLATAAGKEIACEGLNTLCKGLSPDEQQHFMALIRAQCPECFSYDEMALSWDELRKLARHPLITIGAHTIRHPNLLLCSEADLRRELMESKRRLEEQLGASVEHFAYPFGSPQQCGPREFSAAAAAGFESACTTRLGHLHREHRAHMTALPRLCIDYYDGLERFKWKLGGCYAMIQQRGRRVITD